MSAAKWNKPCAECGGAMRPSKARKADYPGTKAYGVDGLCMSCYERKRRGGTYEPQEPLPLTTVQAARRVVPRDLWRVLDIEEGDTC